MRDLKAFLLYAGPVWAIGEVMFWANGYQGEAWGIWLFRGMFVAGVLSIKTSRA